VRLWPATPLWTGTLRAARRDRDRPGRRRLPLKKRLHVPKAIRAGAQALDNRDKTGDWRPAKPQSVGCATGRQSILERGDVHPAAQAGAGLRQQGVLPFSAGSEAFESPSSSNRLTVRSDLGWLVLSAGLLFSIEYSLVWLNFTRNDASRDQESCWTLVQEPYNFMPKKHLGRKPVKNAGCKCQCAMARAYNFCGTDVRAVLVWKKVQQTSHELLESACKNGTSDKGLTRPNKIPVS